MNALLVIRDAISNTPSANFAAILHYAITACKLKRYSELNWLRLGGCSIIAIRQLLSIICYIYMFANSPTIAINARISIVTDDNCRTLFHLFYRRAPNNAIRWDQKAAWWKSYKWMEKEFVAVVMHQFFLCWNVSSHHHNHFLWARAILHIWWGPTGIFSNLLLLLLLVNLPFIGIF